MGHTERSPGVRPAESDPQPRKIHIKTFGCQMNVYDSERMVELLAPQGFAETAAVEEADVVVLNTCHIREKAAEKVYSDLGRIREIKERRMRAGRDTIVAQWGGIIEGKVRLEWRPRFVSIGKDTNVAMSRGPYVFEGKDKDGNAKYGIGDFVSIWIRRDEKSPWHVVLDGGGPPPKDATAEEAARHLASAPASCPRAP